MDIRRASAAAMAAVAALLALTACGDNSSGSGASEEKSFDFNGDRLVIDARSIELQVVPGGGAGIQVQRWLSGTSAKEGNASWTLKGDTLKLTVNCSGLVLKCGSQYKVAVPRDLSVVVRSGDGEYSLSGLSGAVVVEGGSGPVSASKITGDLKISTGEGEVTVSDSRSRTVQVTSDLGDVKVNFAAAPQLADIKSNSGDVTVKVPTAGQHYQVSVDSGTGEGGSKVPNDSQSGNVVKVSSAEGDATLLPA
jgi:Putative adhesin